MELLAIERTLTELDHVRLTKLVHRHKCGRSIYIPKLPIEQLLDEADIVNWREVSPEVITMHSRVLVKDLQTGAHRDLTLCYPDGADAGAGLVSVLSPVGWCLLGQKVGATVHWPTPSGAARAAEILQILFQPESSGDFAMQASDEAPLRCAG